MLEIWKQKIIVVIEIVHRWVFGHEISPTMKDFLGHLSWSFLGVIVNGLALFAVNVMAGRLMGPEGYGKYNLIQVVSNIIIIPILLGLNTTSIKYISRSKDENEKNKYLSNSFWIVLISSLLIFFIWIIFHGEISKLSNISESVVLLTLLFTIIFAYRTLLDSLIKSFKYFKFQSISYIIEGVIILLSFVLFFLFLGIEDYKYYIFSIMIGYTLISLLYIFKIKDKIRKIDWQKIMDVLEYSKAVITMVMVAAIMGSMDRLFIGKGLGAGQLGIYSAYMTSTCVFVGQVIIIFDNVFFPMVSGAENKDAIIKKIDKLFFIGFIPSVCFLFFCSFIIMKLFGKQFEINLFYILIFSILAFFQSVGAFYKSVVSSVKKSYLRLKKISYVFLVLFFLLYFVIFIQKTDTLKPYIFAYVAYITSSLIITRLSYIHDSQENT